jgi:glycerol-3-phosphate acyltransferase PlsX
VRTMIPIAIDAMGGDRGPRVTVQGALAAARDLALEPILVGPEAELRHEVTRVAGHHAAVRVVDAPDVVEMHESPTDALRRKPGASVKVAVGLVASGEAAAMVSVGHTGAVVMAAHGAFGMISGSCRSARKRRRGTT